MEDGHIDILQRVFGFGQPQASTHRAAMYKCACILFSVPSTDTVNTHKTNFAFFDNRAKIPSIKTDMGHGYGTGSTGHTANNKGQAATTNGT
jgi:hypothetical protein